MKKLCKFITVAVAFVGAASLQGAVIKKARITDVASEYILEDDGAFYRKVGKIKCQITNKVESFKISQHPSDLAVVYFKQKGNLNVLHNATRNGQCPRVSSKVIMFGVAKYSVVSSIHSHIVNMALSESGRFMAWDNNKAVFTRAKVKKFQLNSGYGVKGRVDSKYIAYLKDVDDYLFKLNGYRVLNSEGSRSVMYEDFVQGAGGESGKKVKKQKHKQKVVKDYGGQVYVSRVDSGMVRISFSDWNKKLKYQVNFYLDGKFAANSTIEDGSVEVNLQGIKKDTRQLIIRVLNYYGDGRHLKRTVRLER